MNVRIAGLIVAAVIGGVTFVWQVGLRQPPAVAAANDQSKWKSPIIGAAGVVRLVRAGEPGGPGTTGAEGERAVAVGITTGTIVAAHSDDWTAATVAEQPIENLASDADKRRQAEDAATRSSSKVTHSGATDAATNALSEQSFPQAASASPPAGETGSRVDQTDDVVAIRIARIISHVRMRVGPSNSQAVVMTIPEGSPVEVVKCQHWCEVIFAGQRGWVYKGFVGISPIPRRL
jgi:hypothetical protein